MKGKGQQSTVYDVAKYIIDNFGPMSAMKLQKLAFYSQAMALVWDDVPIFEDDFEAWPKGPVCRNLFQTHKGMFMIEGSEFLESYEPDINRISDDHKATINAVCNSLKDVSGYDLSQMTHSEAPWLDARGGLSAGEHCNTIITKESMEEDYQGNW